MTLQTTDIPPARSAETMTGSELRLTREGLHLSIGEAAARIRIRPEILVQVEREEGVVFHHGQSLLVPRINAAYGLPAGIRRCRGCGCTDADCSGCFARTGKVCHWVDTDMCSACWERGGLF